MGKTTKKSLIRWSACGIKQGICQMRMPCVITEFGLLIVNAFLQLTHFTSINRSVLPKGRSFAANSAFSTLPSSQPSFSYLHKVHLSWCCLSSDIFFCLELFPPLPILLEQGFSNFGTRTTYGTRKDVRWYAIKFIKIVQGAKKWKYDPFYLSFGFTYVGN